LYITVKKIDRIGSTMGTNILGIGQSALAAAQYGIATTGHNIANASSVGYNRQVLFQSAAEPQNTGGSFIGQGVQVGQIKRMYNEFIGQQVNATQSTKNFTDAYYNQIKQIDNLIADPTAGASPAMQEFFNSIQNLAATPNGTAGAAARQSVLSSGSALTSRLQGLQGRLDQLRDGVNGQIQASVATINGYATQLSDLNQIIERAQSAGAVPNDLLDHRDNLVTELSKLVNVSVVPQGGQLNVFMGTGQPLVLGAKSYSLQTVASLTDPMRTEVGYESLGGVVRIAENSLNGGQLGGLFSFRSNTLDVSQNSLGRVAIGLASAFNEQHKLGQDLTGAVGGNFFSVGKPSSFASSNNNLATGNMSATIVDVGALTTSDYRVQYQGGNYKITRLSDGASPTPAFSPTLPVEFDGLSFGPPPGVPTDGDEFLIRPTANGVTDFAVVITDIAKIAAATPFATSVPSTNTGSGKISAGSFDSLVATKSGSLTATISAAAVDDSYSGTTLAAPVTLTLNMPGNTLSGFPAGATVSVKNGGVTTNYPPSAVAPFSASVPYTSGATISFSGVSFAIADSPTAPVGGDTFTIAASLPVVPTQITYDAVAKNLNFTPPSADVTITKGNVSTIYKAGTPVPYSEGATISYGGLSFVVSGSPGNGDTFNIGKNISGSGDSRNALLLSKLQTKNTLVGNSTSFQGAYSQFVSLVGNKAHELQVIGASEKKLLAQAVQAQQSESGVNLDEEAANLLRYQQAYQAAGKLMQIASQLFDSILALGR
jgi:flagellar hook-associated protein 1 FlgK